MTDKKICPLCKKPYMRMDKYEGETAYIHTEEFTDKPRPRMKKLACYIMASGKIYVRLGGKGPRK